MTVRLTGVVREASDPPAAELTVSVDGKDHTRTRGGWLLIDASGYAVRVELATARIEGEPSAHEKGPFGELNTRMRAGFAPELAASFTRCKIVERALRAGDAVSIEGEVLEGTEAAPRAVRALRVARGQDAAAVVDGAIAAAAPPAPPDPDATPAAEWGWSAFLVLLAAIAIVLDAKHWLLRGASGATPGLLGAAIVVRPTRTLEYRVRDGRRSDWDLEMVRGITIVFYLMAIGVVSSFSSLVVQAAGSGIAVLALALAELIQRGSAPANKRLVRAAPWMGGAGGPVRVVGTVRDATPVKIDDVTAAFGRRTRGYVGRRMSGINDQKFVATGTFTLETPLGVVEVDPNDLLWSSTVFSKKWDSDDRHYVDIEAVTLGARAVAVGWIELTDGRARLRPSGFDAVVLLAVEPGRDPEALARRVRRDRIVTLAGLAVCGVLSAVLGLLSG